MTGFVIFVHSIICIVLVTVILVQSGRGGGLTEGFASAESMFGAKTNAFLVRTTTIVSVLFLVTCLGLAVLSLRKDRSLMSDRAVPLAETPEPASVGQPVDQVGEEVVNEVNATAEKVMESAEEAAASVTQTPVPAGSTATQPNAQ